MRAVEHRAHQLFQARKLMFEEPEDPHEDPAAEGTSSVNGAEASPRRKPGASKKEADSTKEDKGAADPEKLKKRRYAQKQRLLRQARVAALPPAQQRRLHEAQRGESACYASISRVDKRIVKLEAQLREVRESTALANAGSTGLPLDGDEASTQEETRREALESQLSDLQRAREGHRAEAEQARKDIQQILSAVDENDPAVQEAYRRALADEGEGGAASHKFEIIDDGKDDNSSRAASGPRTMLRRFDHSGLVAMSEYKQESRSSTITRTDRRFLFDQASSSKSTFRLSLPQRISLMQTWPNASRRNRHYHQRLRCLYPCAATPETSERGSSCA